MTETPDKTLLSYRLLQANEALDEGRLLAEAGFARGAVNRAYYAMFYGLQALLASRGLRTSKHSGAIALFDREFVKPGILPRDLSRWLHRMFDLRQDADYGDMFRPSTDEAQEALTDAATFVSAVSDLLRKGDAD